MPISAEQIAGLLDSLGATPDHASRRRARRVKLQGWVQLSLDGLEPKPGLKLDEDGCVRARFADVSARGVRLLMPCRMPIGRHFLLHLPQGFHSRVSLLCRSHHCRSIRTGVYSVGAEFICPFVRPGDEHRG